MQIYLPIAEISLNIFALLALGGIAGLLSGLFGVGGGFIATPILIFMGVTPAVAVATSANQIVAASFSGFYTHWKKQNVDFRMGGLLLAGGMVGSTLGIAIFSWLQSLGQIDLVISVLYVTLLGSIGSLMAVESYRAIYKPGTKKPPKPNKKRHSSLAQRMPWRMRFPRSKLYISAWLPLILGFAVGILVSVMGTGGGFFLIPAMIYLLGMPTSVVVGTSLFQIIFITINVTILHAVTTHSVDIILAVILLLGSSVGAQFGSRWSSRIPAAQLRGLMALLVLIIALRLAYGLVATPDNVYSLTVTPVTEKR